ncbi:MAG: trimeric intracellular cation channel family protein, partial [Chloroflexia bacterium]
MLLHVLDLCGVAVFAISGVASARRAGMDIFGILVIAVITAIGGGTLRDLLLGRQPVFWVQDAAYLIVITGAVAATLVYVRWWTTPTQLLDLADTGGLALFTVGGTQTALSLGTAWHAAIVMGMLSGCAGGILRDVLCGEVPYLLRREVYA